tara:strand:+ start:310 stop:537 length:228 start_codon:yes stop_codon:yes gene_type:complete
MEGATIIDKLWKRWSALPQEKRQEVTQNLGAVGRILNIAANVKDLVDPPIKEQSPPPPDNDLEDEDIIDIEFEEH